MSQKRNRKNWLYRMKDRLFFSNLVLGDLTTYGVALRDVRNGISGAYIFTWSDITPVDDVRILNENIMKLIDAVNKIDKSNFNEDPDMI